MVLDFAICIRNNKQAMASMSSITIFALFFSCLVAQGWCQCGGVKDLQVSLSKTGNFVQNVQEWRVTVANLCSSCNQGDVTLDCEGFDSVEIIDSKILSKSGDKCVINNGQPIGVNGDSFSFIYAWETQFEFAAISSTVSCS